MSFRTSIFLALRYLKPRRSFVTISMALSILGPIIGVAVLVVVISVMNGFHDKFRRKIFGLTSHLRVDNWGGAIKDPAMLVARLEQKGFLATPVIQGPVLVQAKKKAQPVTMLGIDTVSDPNVTEIRESCRFTYEGFPGQTAEADFRGAYDTLKEGEVLVGLRLLQMLGLRIGDTLIVHPTGRLENYVKFDEDGSFTIVEPEDKYLPEELTIVGAFSFGMHQFDSSLVVVSLDQAAELMVLTRGDQTVTMNWGEATEIKVKTDDPFRFDMYLQELAKDEVLGNYRAWSWRDDDLGFFDALQTEKVVMFILLVLIVVVSAFCVCATLITVVFQKTREIGIIKAIGGTPLTIMSIFFLQGACIGFVGIGAGILLGYVMVLVRNDFLSMMSNLLGRNLLPQALYFFDGLPAEVRWQDLTMVGLSAFLLCVLAAVLPAVMAMCISPSRAISAE